MNQDIQFVVLVAQLVEQLVVIQLVAGSNPVWHPKGTYMSIKKSYRIIGQNSPGHSVSEIWWNAYTIWMIDGEEVFAGTICETSYRWRLPGHISKNLLCNHHKLIGGKIEVRRNSRKCSCLSIVATPTTKTSGPTPNLTQSSVKRMVQVYKTYPNVERVDQPKGEFKNLFESEYHKRYQNNAFIKDKAAWEQL